MSKKVEHIAGNKIVKVQRQLSSAKVSIPLHLKPIYYEREVRNDGSIVFTPVEYIKSAVGVKNDK